MQSINGEPVHSFPYEIRELDKDVCAEIVKDFEGYRSGFVEIGPKKYKLQPKYKESASVYYNFQARSDDIWVASYPRSGTTWTQELVWLEANDFDYEMARKIPLNARFPFFEFPIVWHDEVRENVKHVFAHQYEVVKMLEATKEPHIYNKLFDRMEGPRFFKTHFPFSLMPPSIMEKQAKVVYVARNPKDVIISNFHFHSHYKTLGYVATLEKFWYYYVKNGLDQYGPYFEHVKEGWDMRHRPNVLFIFYEDMKKDLQRAIRRVANFLGKTVSVEDVKRLADHLDIENFKKNPAVNRDDGIENKFAVDGKPQHVRNGIVAAWKKEFTPEIIAEIDMWMKENSADTDLTFP